ncbi:hypothetical protein MM5_117 [Morganella phage vB_Mm5]
MKYLPVTKKGYLRNPECMVTSNFGFVMALDKVFNRDPLRTTLQFGLDINKNDLHIYLFDMDKNYIFGKHLDINAKHVMNLLKFADLRVDGDITYIMEK